MFLNELQPIWQEFTKQPIAFMGGFVSGALRLNLAEEPLKSWLEKQGGIKISEDDSHKNNGNGPQTISIE